MLVRALRLGLLIVLLYAAAMFIASCEKSGQKEFVWKPLFGDGLHDSTELIAEVGDIRITRRDLDLRYDELPDRLKSQYSGPEGLRMLLADMVEQTLLVQAAIDRELFRDQDVARSLISQRRETLKEAMLQYGLLRGEEPDEEELREFYDNNKDKYRRQGLVRARHIECLTEDDAQRAFARLQQGGLKNSFPYVVGELSVNKETAANQGETGWFNKGGFLPVVPSGKLFTELTFDLPLGLHPPIKVGDRWHVVEILGRDEERAMSFAEARSLVLKDALPGFQQEIIWDFLEQARTKVPVAYHGDFGPGKGLTAKELLERAMAVKDVQKKLDLLDILVQDYPQDEYADDALLLSATIMLENYQDRRLAARYLERLLKDYPDSPLVEDAKYMRDNIYDPKLLDPDL